MEVEEANLVQEELTVVEGLEEAEKSAESIIMALNSFFGKFCSSSGTMRIKGSVGNKILHILLDTGNSHNFLSDKLFKPMSNKIKTIQPLQVTVAEWGTQMVEGFSWLMQGQ